MKLDPMTEHLKIAVQDREAVQGFIRHILNLPATETDEMMVQRHVRVKARAFMPDIHLAHQAGSPQYAERVIHGIAGDHRMAAFHHAIQIIGRRVTDRSRKRAVDGCTLWSEPHSVMAKPFSDCVACWAHTYLGMIPRYHMIHPWIKPS
jgi:hypothetical protein